MDVNRSIGFAFFRERDVHMNKQEFTRRVLAMENRLYRISCGMLSSHQDRLDAVQEAVVRAWSRIHTLRESQYFETWLTRILINECHNIQKLRNRIVPLESIGEPSYSDAGNPPLRDAVLKLDEEARLPLILHYMEGYRMREIAQILKIPEGTVKTRLVRAKKQLKQLMEEE